LVTLSKIFWTRILGSFVIQLYAGECTPSVDRALNVLNNLSPLKRKLIMFRPIINYNGQYNALKINNTNQKA